MGGGQSLTFGLRNLDTFAWVGGFSSAPNTQPVRSLITDPSAANEKLRLLWVSCGDVDGLMSVSKPFHEGLVEMGVPHIWHVDAGGHTWPVWKNDLYLIVAIAVQGQEGLARSADSRIDDFSHTGGRSHLLAACRWTLTLASSCPVLLHDERYHQDHGCHGDEDDAVRSHDTLPSSTYDPKGRRSVLAHEIFSGLCSHSAPRASEKNNRQGILTTPPRGMAIRNTSASTLGFPAQAHQGIPYGRMPTCQPGARHRESLASPHIASFSRTQDLSRSLRGPSHRT